MPAKTLDQRLADLTIIDPETSEPISVSTRTLLRYINQPNLLEIVISKIRTAAQTKYTDAIDAGSDPVLASKELQADLAALDKMSEELWNGEASILKQGSRFRGIRDAAAGFSKRTYNKYRPATMRIGMIELNDDNISQEPTVIQIDDDYDVQRLGTIRSDTDVVIKGNKTATHIRIHLTFHDIESINTTFRNLLAQCRAAPIISIESDLLIDVMINKFATPETMNFMTEQALKDGDVDFDEPLEKLTRKSLESFDALKDLLASGDEAQLYGIAKARYDFNKRTKLKGKTPLNETIPDRPQYGVAITAALEDVEIKSDPDANHKIDVVLHFRRINEVAYTDGRLQWRKYDGFPTFDITQCSPLREYYQTVYLNDQGDDKQVYMSPIPDQDTQVKCPLQFRWKNYFTGEERHLDLTDTDTAVHTIAIGWRNKLAFMPLIGQHNPTVQHLGTSNASVRMQLITTDREVIRDFNALKDELDQMRRNFSNINRDERVVVTNGLINLVGASEFIISGVSTTTDPRSKDLIYITVTMVESKYSLRDKERVSLFQDYFSPAHTKALWRYLGKIGEQATKKISKRHKLLKHEAEVIGVLFGTGVMNFDLDIHERQGDHRRDVLHSGSTPIPWTDKTGTGLDAFGRGIDGVYDVPATDSNGVLSQHVMIAGLVKYFTRGNDSSKLPWLFWSTRAGADRLSWEQWKRFATGKMTVQDHRSFSASEASSQIWQVFAWPKNTKNSYIRRAPALKNLAWTIQETDDQSETQSKNTFQVFVGQDRVTMPPWFKQKFWNDLYNVIEWRNRDSNPGQAKWAAEHLASAHSHLIGILASGIADNWPGFDQSRFLGNNKFARLGDEGSDRPGSNYPDMYLPTYADIFSESILEANEGPFPGIPELEPRIHDTFILPPDASTMFSGIVIRIEDGDTIELDDNTIIRLAGMNTPETPSTAGDAASLILEQVILNKEVQIELAETPIDEFGRTLAYIWLGDVMINQFMVGAGFAKPTTFEDNQVYREFFEDTENAKVKTYGHSRANGFNRGRILPIWRTFCPRWRDLGIKPPYQVRAAYSSIEEAQDQLARTPIDWVEPGFFYWRSSWKDRISGVNQLGKKAQERAQESKQYTITLEKSDFTAVGDIQDTLGNLITDLLRDGRLDQRHAEAQLRSDRGQAKDLLERINRKDSDVPVINFIDRNGKLIAYAVHAPGSDSGARTRNFKLVKYRGGPLRIRNPYDSSVIAHDEMLKPAGMAEVAGNVVDDHFNPARAYPTYRVYAIEEDREQLIYSDDFYGINCVSSIEIHHSKKNASLAILRITNTTGAFENDAFLDLDAERSKEISADDEGEQYFSSFRFRTGTLIQIRMGYTSKAEDLPIAFSGRVVETQFGPVVTLVCQGHRAELLQEIEMATTTMDPFSILDIAFKKIGPAKSLGRTAKAGEVSQAFARETLGKHAASKITWWGKLWRYDISSHLRNVYVASNSPVVKGWFDFFTDGFTDEYAAATGERLKRFVNWIPGIEIITSDEAFDQWVCPQQPMWNMIQELARHIPGTLAHVVPFEQDGTLFFGKPTTPYIYSNPPIGEKRAFDKMYNTTKKVALTDLSHLVLDRFFKSKYFARQDSSLVLRPNIPINTKKFLLEWSDESFQNAIRLLKSSSKSGVWNWLDYDLHPNDETAKLDFSGDWQYLVKKSPGLARLMFGSWFGLSTTGIFPNTLEGDYGIICRLMCSRLKNTKGDNNDWTPAWQRLESQFINAPNSPLNFDITNTVVFGRTTKGMIDKITSVITENHITWSEANKILSELEAGGHFPQATIDLIREQLGDKPAAYEEFELGTRETQLKNYQDVRNAIETVLGGTEMMNARERSNDRLRAGQGITPAGHSTQLSEIVRHRAASFRLFVFYVAHYLRKTTEKGGIDAKHLRADAIKTTLEDSRSFMLPPGWKQFRDYHVVTSKNDIIENKITATMEEMHNAVTIRHPDGTVETSLGELTSNQVDTQESSALHEDRIFITEDQDWASFPKTGGIGFRPTIGKEYRKLLVRVENNANSRDKAARCLLSNVAEAIRPMYRGTLLVMGRVMKPYDVVHVNDTFTDMIGPIEVDEVIHHFNADAGWVTTIVPHALVHTVDNISSLQHDSFVDWISEVSEWYADNWFWVELGLLATSAITGGGSLAVGALIRGGINVAARTVGRAAVVGLGETAMRKVLFGSTLRRAFFKAAARTLSRAGGRQAASKAGTSAVKTAMAQNPKVFFGMIGRFLNAGAHLGQALNPLAALGSVSLQTIFATTHIKARWGSTNMPVDIQPLMLKGRPFTAGLEYGYDDTYNFADKFQGFLKDLWDAAADGVDNIDKLISGSTETSVVQKLLDPD